MMRKEYDVVTLGELLIDFTEYGTSAQGNPLWEANPGGAPCNVLAMLRRLGKQTAFIGKVGRDVYGDQLRAALVETGIDTTGLLTDEKVHTTLAIVHKKPDGDRDFSFYREPGADMNIRYEEVPEGLIENARIFHFGTLSMTHATNRDATVRAVARARECGALISFDPNLRRPLWADESEMRAQMAWGLGQCDILKISDDEIFFFTGEKDFAAASKKLTKQFPNIRLLTVTAGPDGSYCSYGGFFEYVPAFLMKNTVETTGAGDTYGACVLNYILEHGICGLEAKDLREMMTFAGAAAAIVTTRKGALRVMPTREEVNALIAERK